MDVIPDVVIDEHGVFKYVLIEISDASGAKKLIVRGWARAEYHDDIYQEVKQTVGPKGFRTDIKGGGRISHDPDRRKILVYGYSVAYGRANHADSVALIQRAYPGYSDITFSNEGY